jgi:putative heme-binding domain-containing protein
MLFHCRVCHFVLISVLTVITISCNREDVKDHPEITDPKIEKLKLPEGFRAELLYTPSEHQQGSWVAMTFDDKGRMITSDQYGSLYRITIPPVGDTSRISVEPLALENNGAGADSVNVAAIGFAQGLLYAFNSLYVVVNNSDVTAINRTSGLYRLEDTNGNDQFDKITLLKSLKGSGEHGPHSIKLSPDGRSLYLVAGNHTDLPEMDRYLLPPVWKEDNMLPLIKDPRGHATERKAPGGWIARLTPDGARWELISAGFRNPFDIAFNNEGELFTYDSDMEWDFGMPWYRPTRICHVTSGSEFGWRTGNGKWSASFPDNLPPVLNIGQGSPTNLISAAKSAFPEKYRHALLASDWSFGIIYAVHLTASGASYKATAEEFLSGAPLPLTDGEFGPDGAFYFLTGGRRLESDLYRITYTGQDKAIVPSPSLPVTEPNETTTLRRQIESFHSIQPGAVELVWPQLKHEDRFIRYAARIAIEHQPISQWQRKALDETDPVILTGAMIALARHGKSDLKNNMIEALCKVDYESLTPEQQLDILRAFELVLLRLGEPEGKTKAALTAYLDPKYPAATNAANRALSKILVYLGTPSVVSKTIPLLANAKDDQEETTAMQSSDLIFRNPQYGLDIAEMLSNVPPAQQTFYATVLSEARAGWTSALREQYFRWYASAFTYKGGRSYIGFIDRSRQMALSRVPAQSLQQYNAMSGGNLLKAGGNDLADLPVPKGPWKEWKEEEALVVITQDLSGRDFARGKDMYAGVLCRSCHTMNGQGGSIGPDLTQLGTRFSAKDMLIHIMQPDKEVSDQYAPMTIVLNDGKTVVARLVNENASAFIVSQNPFAPDVVREIPKRDVKTTRVSRISLMPGNLINRLNDEELKDLFAYLMAGGNPEHSLYKKQSLTKGQQ